MTDLLDAPTATAGTSDKLVRRDEILHAIGFAARRFLGTEDLETAMPAALERLGQATGVSRTYVFRNFTGPDGDLRTGQRWEWAAAAVSAEIDNEAIRDTDYESAGFGRWRTALERGEALYGPVDSFPPSERAILEAQAIRSLAVVPILDGARWWGFIGFDDCEGGRDWEDAEVAALQAAAGVIGAALQRRESAQALHERDLQLRQMRKMEALGRLAGGVAHDFNNVLMIIRGHAELLREDLATASPDQRRTVEAIRGAAVRGAELAQRLLELGRRRDQEPEPVLVDAVVDRQEEFLRRALGSHIDVRIVRGADGASVWIDPAQLDQVVINLAINARDAMERGGRLEVATGVAMAEDPVRGDRRRWVRLTVADTGAGMDAETRNRIFEPYFTTKADGTGLGLATVYGIVQQAGGHMKVESEPGRGTRFTVLIPAMD